jgi:hypothetical protein
VQVDWATRRGADLEAAIFWIGDYSGASALERQVQLRKQAGDITGAEQLRRFGLNDDGSTATSLE